MKTKRKQCSGTSLYITLIPVVLNYCFFLFLLVFLIWKPQPCTMNKRLTARNCHILHHKLIIIYNLLAVPALATQAFLINRCLLYLSPTGLKHPQICCYDHEIFGGLSFEDFCSTCLFGAEAFIHSPRHYI